MAHLIDLSAINRHDLICQISVRESDLSESQICQRVRSASHGLTRPHRFESPIGLPQLAGRESPILGPIRLLRPVEVEVRLARGSDSHGRPAMGGRSDSQICEAVGVRARPLTRKSCDLSESPIGLTDLRVRSASHGLTRPHRFEESDRPHRFESPIGLSRTPAEAMRLAVKSVR